MPRFGSGFAVTDFALEPVRTFGDGVLVRTYARRRRPAYAEGMDSSERVCPECGQPVETVVKRHKTLGAWVPVWVSGPCSNPTCEAYAPRAAESGEPGETAAKKT